MSDVLVVLVVLIVVAVLVRRFWKVIIAFVLMSGVAALATVVYLIVQELQAMT